jgi:hypothetical protein
MNRILAFLRASFGKIRLATFIMSAVALYFMYMPSMGIDMSVRPPTDHKMLYYSTLPSEAPSAWPEIRETITWAIGTVNGVMLIAAAWANRRRRKRR